MAKSIHVIVVDDVVRFALHVWRFLGRGIGFGIGLVDLEKGSRYFYKDNKNDKGDEPRALSTPDGRAFVWWVPASFGWESKINKILSQTPGEIKIVLIDVKSSCRDYSFDRVLDFLAGRDDVDLRVVSSYAEPDLRRHPKCEFWPKSPDLLCDIEKKIGNAGVCEADLAIPGQEDCLDVLITGAGFEMRFEHKSDNGNAVSTEVGACDRFRSSGGDRYFGLPRTPSIIWNMPFPFGARDGVMFNLGDKNRLPPLVNIEMRSRLDNLDDWWDFVLEHFLRQGDEGKNRREEKIEARKFERRLREAFRLSILQHDWGHLSQSLKAAGLPWDAWLTTNYTRFTDRAIDLWSRHRSDNVGSIRMPRWRIVSTSEEARWLSREEDSSRDDESRGEQRQYSRVVFKLHGDISHLETMAIAGHDKEIYSTLSVHVDSLHEVYGAAEKHLQQLISSKTKLLRWHIVGHGLADQTLKYILIRITKKFLEHADKGRRVKFVIVDLFDPKRIQKCIEEHLGSKENPYENVEYCPETMSAESYMAKLYSKWFHQEL